MPTVIPLPPEVPNRLEGTTAFNLKAGPFADWMARVAPALAALGFEVTALADAAANAAASAQAAGSNGISTSTTSNTIGSGSKTWTVAETGKTYAPGISLTIARTSDAARTFMRGIITGWNSGTRQLTVECGLAAGAGTFTDWTISVGTAGTPGATSETYEARTANVQLTAADSGKFIDITSGSFTQTFAVPASLGNAWRIRIRNSSTGDITIPSSDGMTNWPMYPGEVRDFNCDGAMLRSVPLKGFVRAFSAFENFIGPPGYRLAGYDLLGAGGGGGRGPNNSTVGGGGGGGGGRSIGVVAITPGAVMPVVVGAGGLGATTPNAPGGIGGNTTFAGITAYGGGSANALNPNVGGNGGPAHGGGFYQPAQGSSGGVANGSGNGSSADFGGGSGGAAGANGPANAGGSSAWGGGGGGGGGFEDTSSVSRPGAVGGSSNDRTVVAGGAAGTASGTSAVANGGNGGNGLQPRHGGGGGGAASGNTGGVVQGGSGGNGNIGGGGGGGGAAYGANAACGNGGNGGRGDALIWGII